jgi:hypothetical protein
VTTCEHVSEAVPHRTSDGRYEFNVIRQIWDGIWYRVIEFGHPIRQCKRCGSLCGYPFDPQNLPETDEGLADELAICLEAQS